MDIEPKIITVSSHSTAIGELVIGAFEGRICLLNYGDGRRRGTTDRRVMRGLYASMVEGHEPIIDEAKRQVDEYLAGVRREFSLPLLMVGTEFQRTVWSALQEIPYGATVSYSELAKSIRREHAVRAVAQANGANALSLVVPCHRVIERGGRLGGYGGGVKVKEQLLALERRGIGNENLLDGLRS
ncbi:MAG: cysteine methyltransferase [Bacteroidia bacterium]|nr:MAG: cysteine methyltransferase [Bacteroidia bacterium]